jgi:hypothetical protein
LLAELLSCQRGHNCGSVALEKSTTSVSGKTLCVLEMWEVSDL